MCVCVCVRVCACACMKCVCVCKYIYIYIYIIYIYIYIYIYMYIYIYIYIYVCVWHIGHIKWSKLPVITCSLYKIDPNNYEVLKTETLGRCPCGVMVKPMDSGTVVREFEFQSHCAFTFGQITMRKLWASLSSQIWVK